MVKLFLPLKNTWSLFSHKRANYILFCSIIANTSNYLIKITSKLVQVVQTITNSDISRDYIHLGILN